MEKRGIVKIKVKHLYPHPDNPRKNIGDVTELAESIKKNGIMQNLTVIPFCALNTEPDEQPEADELSLISDFHVLIGHRRLQAAKEAGLTEVPCQIRSKISRKEQVGIMLLENMQREDLTIQEQAQGFQMMLDLGDTEEQIAEKTGFSKTTVRHRLNIAKLDQEKLKEKQQDDAFQLSLKDLYELEKIKDIKKRNEILDAANDSRDIVSRVRAEISNAKKKENAKKLKKKLKEKGIEIAPEQYKQQMYYPDKWKTVTEFNLFDDVPDELKLPEGGQMYWYETWRDLRIVAKVASKKKKLSKEELAKKEQKRKVEEVKKILKGSAARRKEFIAGIISGKIPAVKDEATEKDKIWDSLVSLDGGFYKTFAREFFLDKEGYKCSEEERKQADADFKKLRTMHQMLVFLNSAMNGIYETYDWKGRYDREKAEKLMKGYEALEPFGWFFEEDEEKQVLDGTSELYTPTEEK